MRLTSEKIEYYLEKYGIKINEEYRRMLLYYIKENHRIENGKLIISTNKFIDLEVGNLFKKMIKDFNKNNKVAI